VLLIEDNPDDAELVEMFLTEAGFRPTISVIDSEEELRDHLHDGWDIVVADYALPGFSAPRALTVIQERGVDLPFVVVSGCIGEEATVELMKQGAADCVRKDNLVRLPPAVSRALRENENRLARQRAEQELERLAYFDELTGLPNRRHFKEQLQSRLELSKTGVGVVVLHCSRMRMIGATLGEGIGQSLLREVAGRLRGSLPVEVAVGQMGCTEFALAVPFEHCGGDWESLAARVCSLFVPPFVVDKRELFLTATLGMSRSPLDGNDVDILLRGAQAAMHRAHAGGLALEFHSREMEQEGHQRLLVSNRLRGALQREEFEVHYQPKVRLTGAGAGGMEALLRWHDRELGSVSPAEFIPVAEQSGEIVEIGAWVLRTVCGQIAEWRRQGLGLVRVAVNVSTRQLRDPGFVEVIGEALAAAGLPSSALELELTESDIMADTALAVSILSDIRAMGVRISVDDFGTGYSSLAYLKKLPLSILKVDRSFIADVPGDGESCAIVEAIVGLAHNLGLAVVAEGVETEAQRQFLLELGCEQAQGYLFSRPLAPDTASRYLRKQHRQTEGGATFAPAPAGAL